jgi:hypothetical protein
MMAHAHVENRPIMLSDVVLIQQYHIIAYTSSNMVNENIVL